MSRIAVILILLTIAARPAVANDEAPAGEQVSRHLEKEITITVELDYLLYLPPEYAQDDQEWPLLLFLHGAGESGDDLETVKVHGPPKLIAAGQDFPFVVVSPQSPHFGWDVLALHTLLDEITTRYRIDEDRVYVTGLSMGGMGTWALAASRPDRFAAIVPICGGGNRRQAPRLKDLPIRIFQGAKDPVVRPETAQAMYDALQRAGAKDVELTIYPDADHDSWTRTYDDPSLYEWLLEQKRSRQPAADAR